MTTKAEQFVEELSCLCVLLWTDSAAMRATITTTTQAVPLLRLSFFRDVTNMAKKRENVPELYPFFIVASRYCALAEAPADGSVRRVFRSALEIKASIFTASGEDLFLMSAAVRVPFHSL